MERLIIVVDCPDEWRERLDLSVTARRIGEKLKHAGDPMVVRVRWQSMDTEGV